MLIVRPVPDPEKAKKLCDEFDRPYDPDVMTYYAFESEDETGKDAKSLGLCRLTLKGGRNEIISLDYAKGTKDTEALIITARAVMNFMYRCEVRTAYLGDGVPDELSSLLGFERMNGRRAIDLFEFYKSPCRYGEKNG